MLGILYIIFAILFGKLIIDVVFPSLYKVGKYSFSGQKLKLPSLLVRLPAYFYTGILSVTWLVYLLAYLISVINKNIRHPLYFANSAALVIILAGSFVLWKLFYFDRNKNIRIDIKGFNRTELILFGLLLLFIVRLMYMTMYVKDGSYHVADSVFSDFATHIGMARSFSYGNNFPTQYSHFAGEDIRYHFMFQFLMGNLNFLGLRLEHAFNIPSILSLFFACCLLYVLGTKITGIRLGGGLSVLFMLFRSSPSFFTFLSTLPKEGGFALFWENRDQMNYTPNEVWGLWNLNVYVNQRHLAFSMGVVFFVLILYIPYVYEMFDRIYIFRKKNRKKKWLDFFLLNRSAVMPKRLNIAVGLGVLLGLMAFWNGAMLIGGLSILFVLALCSRHRLDYVITAVIAVGMSLLQSKWFIKGSAVSPTYYYGFIAENKTFWGLIWYMFLLWGLLFIFLVLYPLFGKGEKRYVFIAFMAPLVLATHVSLTGDVTVNHKYIMLSEILLKIIPAGLIAQLFMNKRYSVKLGAFLLTALLTCTGIYELRIISNIDRGAREYAVDDPLAQWIKDNSSSKDIWLTPNYSLSRSVMAGTMMYYGWPYYAWSAGYDTYKRDEIVREMYNERDPNKLKAMLSDANIRFILIENANRTSEDYTVDEGFIASLFKAVYTEGEGDGRLTIYDVLEPY